MKTNRRSAVTQATTTFAPMPHRAPVRSRVSAYATELGDKAQRAASLASKLLMLWLFALPLFAHAVVTQVTPAVSFFGASTSPNGTDTAFADLPNVTVPGGLPARLLVVTASNTFYGNVLAVNFAGLPMTRAVQISDNYGTNSIWVLPLGFGDAVTGTVGATYGSLGASGVTAHAYVSAVTFIGVDQAAPTSSPVIGATRTGASTLTVASAVGDLVYDVADFYSTLTGGPTVNVGAGQTVVAGRSGTIQVGTEAWRNSSEPGAASVTMSWSGNAHGVAHAAINIRQAPPADLTVTKTVQGSGPFVRGGIVSFDLTANNISASSLAGSARLEDVAPNGLIFLNATGSGWTCSVLAPTHISCELGNFGVILPNASAPPLTIVAYIKPDAPASITNTAMVSGSGQTDTTNDTDSVTIFPVNPPDLTLTKVANGTFRFGGSASYTLTVTNAGGAATTAGYAVTDTLPTGLTAGTVTSPDAGWNCTASTSAIVSCSRSTPLAAGDSTTLNIPVNIAANAPASITNTASVTGGGEVVTSNNAGSSTTSVIAVTPDLTLTKVAQGAPFQQGGTVSYLITVTNSGNGATTGTITMQDTIPTGLSVTSVSGTGWTCTSAATVSCTRTTALAAGASSVITLAANIAGNAPASITNTAGVVGGGESNTSNNSGSSVIGVAARTSVTINVPTGISYTFNSQTGTGSQVFSVAPGTYTLATTTPQPLGAGSRAVFISWSDSGAVSHSVTVGASAVTITGSFATQYQLTTAGIDGTVAPATGSFFNAGASVNVTATPNGGFVFSNWTGPVANATAAATTVTMDAAKSVTANFTAIPSYTLNVSVSGGTWGSVVSAPAGINCPGTCASNFADGTVVTLTRVVNAGADGEFVGWTDPPTCALLANSASATCAVTMSAPAAAAARFTVNCGLDVDADGAVRSSADTLMITRRILGISGPAVIAGAFNPGGNRTAAAAINAHITQRLAENRYDLNLDGVTDWRDALLLSRAFSGFTGTAVTDGLITPGSQRQFWDQPTPSGAADGIRGYLINRCGATIR